VDEQHGTGGLGRRHVGFCHDQLDSATNTEKGSGIPPEEGGGPPRRTGPAGGGGGGSVSTVRHTAETRIETTTGQTLMRCRRWRWWRCAVPWVCLCPSHPIRPHSIRVLTVTAAHQQQQAPEHPRAAHPASQQPAQRPAPPAACSAVVVAASQAARTNVAAAAVVVVQTR
jgi:hypothetical protein